MKTGSLALYHMPGHLIRRCHQISVALFMKECADYGVTPIQFAVLSALQSFPGEEQAAIAGRVAIDRSTTGNVVLRLEERGLLRRDPDSGDRRVKRLTLTEQGHALLDAIGPAVAGAQDKTVAPLDETERDTLITLLQKIADGNNRLSRVPLTGETEDEKA